MSKPKGFDRGWCLVIARSRHHAARDHRVLRAPPERQARQLLSGGRGRGGGGGGGGGLLNRGCGCSSVLIRGRGYSGGRGQRGRGWRTGGGGSWNPAGEGAKACTSRAWVSAQLSAAVARAATTATAAAATVLTVLRLGCVGLVQNEEVSTGREKREKHAVAEDEKNGEEVKNGENGEDEEMPAH